MKRARSTSDDDDHKKGSHQDDVQVEEKSNPNHSESPQQQQQQSKQQPPCWKCKGHGHKYSKSTQEYNGSLCKVCNGNGYRLPSTKSQSLANQSGRILQLRGYPDDHPLKQQQYFPDGFAGPRAVWGKVLLLIINHDDDKIKTK